MVEPGGSGVSGIVAILQTVLEVAGKNERPM